MVCYRVIGDFSLLFNLKFMQAVCVILMNNNIQPSAENSLKEIEINTSTAQVSRNIKRKWRYPTGMCVCVCVCIILNIDHLLLRFYILRTSLSIETASPSRIQPLNPRSNPRNKKPRTASKLHILKNVNKRKR
jgi:hypothetical protein